MNKVAIITPIPDMGDAIIQQSMLRKAHTEGIIDFNVVDLRNFGQGNYRQIDDTPYGGGGGMVLMAEPLFAALDHTIDKIGAAANLRVIYPSPQGKQWSQDAAQENSSVENLIFICGHYKDIDHRVIDKYVTHEYSIGDYVVTSGEIPTMIMIDSIVRLLPGVLNNFDSAKTDSFFTESLLDAPYYTKPKEIDGLSVPEVLMSGNHEKIAAWRQDERSRRTEVKRPDLGQARAKKLESSEN